MNIDFALALALKAIPILEVGILFFSLFIVTTTTTGHILHAYRWQTLLLLLTAMAAVAQNWEHFSHALHWREWVFLGALIAWPLFLMGIIGRALSLATISESKWRLRNEDWMDVHRAWADASFYHGKPTMTRMGVAMGVYLFLVVFAFVVVFRFIPQPESAGSRIGLGVVLALQFAGLFTLMSKREIISQVLGLFVMDHGMYMGMILLIAMPSPAWDFLLALYLYTFITLLLLFFLLPNLRRIKNSIDLDTLQEESQLKG